MKLPRPLEGFDSKETVDKLLQWGKRLATSAKLRESDAGALIIRDVFAIYCNGLDWKISISDDVQSDYFSSDLSPKCSNNGLFINSICGEISKRLKTLQSLFESMKISDIVNGLVSPSSTQSNEVRDIPYCHGLFVSLKYCLMSLKALIDNNSSDESWQNIFRCIYALSVDGLKIAMTVVAEASSDVVFAISVGTNETTPTKGPVNSSISMSASYVNANSTIGGGIDDENHESDVQGAVVAAWLLVKESVSMLAFLIEISPVTTSVSTKQSSLLPYDDVYQAGFIILDALGRLKHMGAIAEAHLALQSISSTMLR